MKRTKDFKATINYYGKLFDGDVISPGIKAALEGTREFAALTVRSRTPVDTGRLKSQWNFDISGNGIRFKNSTPYAGFVEYGTSKMAPRAMLTRSLPDIQDYFNKSLANEIGKRLGERIIADSIPAPYYNTSVSPEPPKPRLVKDSMLERLTNRFRGGL